MVNVGLVADFFIDIANKRTDDSMTNLKLNKLLYYAQGTYLARTGEPLFKDTIQAWNYGPVVPNVYHKYSKYGKDPITVVSEDYSPCVFSSDVLDVLTDVMVERGQFTGSRLIDFTHREDPWKNVYKENTKGVVISTDSLKSYFSLHPIKSSNLSDKVKKVKALPKELYDQTEDDFWENCRAGN